VDTKPTLVASDLADVRENEWLHLLAERQALQERLRELEQGHREVMAPRYYFLWRLLGRQQEAVERGEAPEWTSIQTAASALIEYNGIQSALVCELHNAIAAYIALAEMASRVTRDEIEARAALLAEEQRTPSGTVVAATPPLAH